MRLPPTVGVVYTGVMMERPKRLLGLCLLLPSLLGAVPTLCLNGRPWTGAAALPQGAWAEVTVRGVPPTLPVTLRERGTGVIWHEGPAAACRAGLWLIRPGTLELEATLGPKTQRVTLEARAPKGAVLYPGLLMRLIWREGKAPPLPKAEAFRPPPTAVAADPALSPEAKAYPPFRTAESAVRDPGDAPFRLPGYWHRPVEDLRLGAAAGKAAVSVPDLGRGDVSARVEGFLLIDRAGTYGFRVETNAETETIIGRKRLLGAESLRLTPGAIPLAVTVAGREKPSFALLWKPPGTEVWEPVPPERFLHAVPAAAERCYAAFTQKPSRRRLEAKEGGNAPEAGQEPPAAPDAAAYRSARDALLRRFRNTGDLAAAERLLRWAKAYFTHAREVYAPRWLRLQDSALLADGEALRPFLETCLTVPTLQRAALGVRVTIARNADMVFGRAFFSEWHQGTNDAYGDRDNFVGLIWQAAALWDDPTAYDAARCLYDSHFAHRPGTAEGLESDGTFNFHAANGRQLNMGAYGKDWANRALRFARVGTPWGETRRQYERLAAYVLAYEWFSYRGAMAFCANGRHNTHEGSCPREFAERLLALPKACLSEGTRTALAAMRARQRGEGGRLEGNRFFFRQLQSVHRRADYWIDVKMSSPLVGGAETFAGQNPGNLSFGDGVTTLLRKGDEYRPIHRYTVPDALWRFRSLPGTTQLDEEWGCTNPWKGLDRYRAGGGARAGGVSDGTLGHCGFAFVSHGRNATRARKLFVFLEDGMFVLGGGIVGGKPAQEPFAYRSTLNQTALTGPVSLLAEDGTAAEIPAGTEERHLSFPLRQRFWVEHGGIGYLVLPSDAPADREATLHVRVSVRTPSNRLIPRILDAPDADMVAYKAKCAALTEKGRRATVLEIWVDHGAQPKGASVAYYVCMRPERIPPAALLKASPAVVLANDATCQAVKDMASGTLHAFFHEAGTLPRPPRIGVDRPASLMLRPSPKGWVATVQDPVAACAKDTAQHAQSLTLSLGGTRRKIALPGAGDPDDRRRGAPVTVPLKAVSLR